MTIKRLAIQYLRNLTQIDLEPAAHLNVIYGDNGSGKTSLLEAISVLSMGRSFRSRKIKSLIQHQQQQLTVFGRLTVASDPSNHAEIPVGVQRDLQGGGAIKVAGKLIASASALTENLPLQLMNGHSFQLLEGAPQERRQFMDWLVFHVEHEFLPTWKAFQKALKQRNTLLRHDKISPLMLAPWDASLTESAEKLDNMRSRVFDRFYACFQQLVEDFIAIDGLTLNYYRGWERTSGYASVLEQGMERDIHLGYTRVGPHRADIRIAILGQPAAEILSRGQQKLLVSAMRIAQAVVFQQLTGRRCIYLIDDLPAELDSHYQQVLAGWLDRLSCQVFVTGVDRDTILKAWPESQGERSVAVFHVEHGKVTLCKNSPETKAETTDNEVASINGSEVNCSDDPNG